MPTLQHLFFIKPIYYCDNTRTQMYLYIVQGEVVFKCACGPHMRSFLGPAQAETLGHTK